MPAFHSAPHLSPSEIDRLTIRLPNPKYVEVVRLYRRAQNGWRVPLGMRESRDAEIPSYELPDGLYEHQIGCIEAALKKTYGLLHLSVGAGKSLIALHLSRILNLPTVIIVPRAHLVEQFYADALKFGIHTENIRVVTWQSLNTKEKVRELNDFCRLLIIDECHLALTKIRLSILFSFSQCERVYFMSGTPIRTDGLPVSLITGLTLFSHTPTFYSPTVHVYPFSTDLGFPESKNWYSDLQDELAMHEDRNEYIAEIARKYPERRTLILCKRVKHAEMLKELIGDSEVAVAGQEIPDSRIILGTFSLLSTGINLPDLSAVLFAGDIRSKVLAEQSAGRCLRYLFSKPDPIIIHVPDMEHNAFRKQFHERQEVYESKGWKMEWCG